jgi:hypothetical protein
LLEHQVTCGAVETGDVKHHIGHTAQ